MTIVLSTVGVALSALCVGLVVRIVNRRERWAKRTLAAVVAVLIGYPLSFGPACWISSHAGGRALVDVTYQPLMQLWWKGRPPISDDLLDRCTRFAAKPGWGMGLAYESGDYGWGERP